MKRAGIAALAVTAVALTCCVGARSDDESSRDVRPARVQPANLTRTAIRLHAKDLVLAAFAVDGDGANGAQGSIQPGVALWDGNAGRIIVQRQINVPPSGNYTTATSNTVHDAPQIVRTASGFFAFYGAASTYVGYHPPQDWVCQGRLACEPFKFAPARTNESDLPNALARSSEYLMPSVGISELSYATVGDATIIGGQQQPTAPYGQAGSQAYVVLHSGAAGASFDTAAGPWNFTSSHVPPAPGLQMVTLAPSDDAYADFGITQAGSGPGSVSIQIASAGCRVSINSAGSAATAAQQIAAAFDSSCPALRAEIGAVQVLYDPALRIGGTAVAPAAVGLVARHGSPSSLPRDVSIHCDGAISCGTALGPDRVADVRGSGLHLHALYGGIEKIGQYVYYLMDVEQATGGWLGKGQSSSGLALACFRAGAPSGAQWTWTDCAGHHPFAMSPTIRPVQRLTENAPYLIKPPSGGYGGEMTPYVYNWSAAAQQNGGLPVIASVSTAALPNGKLLFVHGCQARNRALTLCYALYNQHSGSTERAGTIDVPAAGGSLASLGLAATSRGAELAVMAGEGDRWGCGSRGACLMTYRYDDARSAWTRIDTRVLGGDENAGFPGTIEAEEGAFVIHFRRLENGEITLSTMLQPIAQH